LAEALNSGAPELETLLAKLPSDQREAFAMLKLDGLSIETASMKAGVSAAALKVRAPRAYKALKRVLGE
jgi:RNA polymerase sigma-70 factor (ECF subfamily)